MQCLTQSVSHTVLTTAPALFSNSVKHINDDINDNINDNSNDNINRHCQTGPNCHLVF